MSDPVRSPGVGSAFDMVCLTASLGGVRAYAELLAELPAGFPAAVLLVQHRSTRGAERFTDLLARRSSLPVVALSDGQWPAAGTVHVVPAGQEAVFDSSGRLALRPVAGHRLADAMFASAAALFGPRMIAAVLTGRLDDGACGVRYVKGAGGRVLAQDAVSCAPSGGHMPAAAIATGCVDFILPLPVLAHALTALVMVPGAAQMMRVALPPWAQTLAGRMDIGGALTAHKGGEGWPRSTRDATNS